jgi:glutamyl-tRNA synthetase
MRVRFPPSPTGALHIGNARTALYNWLLARGQGGALVLRIEDTDRERSTPENVETIFAALAWLGIDWDEGPILQSANAARHAEVVEQLLADGHAYRSTAGPEEVRAYKEAHDNRGFRGAEGSNGEGAVRLRVPDEGVTVVRDVVRGETAFENALLDDLVIARADGTPIYHLAVVVDDYDAGITHVVRGADHYSNTPKQILIQQAIGAPTPIYAHLPLLHGPDGKKLSKRHGATSVQDLRDAGYLPEAVINYLALLGWGYDEETTFHTVEELKARFRLERVSKAPAVFDEQKLRWMNGRYLRELSVDDLTARLEAFTGRTGLREAVAITQDKISTLAEFWPLARSFFEGPVDDPDARAKVLGKPEATAALAQARSTLAQLPEPWEPEAVERVLREAVERSGLKAKQVFQPLRVALTGTTVSPGIFETVALLGRDETLARVDEASDGRQAA